DTGKIDEAEEEEEEDQLPLSQKTVVDSYRSENVTPRQQFYQDIGEIPPMRDGDEELASGQTTPRAATSDALAGVDEDTEPTSPLDTPKAKECGLEEEAGEDYI